MNIVRPSTEQVSMYLEKCDSLENYVLQEGSLWKLFAQTYPRNFDMEDVLIKVCSLNTFYSTNIFLHSPLLSTLLIWTLISVSYSSSFHWCSHHFPECYPIYDSFVEKMLMYFKRVDNFFKFKKDDLRHYPTYYSVLTQFSNHYGLDSFNLKEIDKYLWQAGKDNFSKQC